MIIPQKRLCDLCKNEIPSTDRHSTMSYPLDHHDIELLAPKVDGTGREVFPGLRLVTFAKPETFLFEFCRGCVDGILPMLAELKTEKIKTFVDDRVRQRRLQEDA